jgi:hypothetical protein
MNAKQILETQIASETHNDPEVGVTDACESFKNVPDDIEKLLPMLDQRKLWAEVGIPKMNTPTRIMI